MEYPFLDFTTLKFLLNQVHDLQGLLEYPRYRDHDKTSIDLYLDAVAELADRELYSCFRDMDSQPAHYEDGEIIVHPKVPEFIRKAEELGMLAAWPDAADGGMQLPSIAVNASYYILEAANNNLQGYIGLVHGAAELILTFGSAELKETYVPQMMAGKWGGTMCLTEAQAGSSLSDVATQAVPNGDHYRISGQKIFISGGDYRGSENIIHLVLARIEGAPPGVKGISLFLVPRERPGPDGNLVNNDVTTVADFQKMGQQGFCTTHLAFGDRGECHGWLVGEPNKGLAYMFQMMNSARIGVGRGAAAITMAAYRASLAYARERPQGRPLSRDGKKDPSEEQVLIINHPDVKRMLLLQKAVAEGSLSLILLASRYHDLSRAHPDASVRRKYHDLLEVVTPVAKTYPSEMGVVSVSNGLQVLGGYGFCSDFVLQQYYRDIRIYPLYEGTTGIQSQDLLGRKLVQDNGRAFDVLCAEITDSIDRAAGQPELVVFAGQLKTTIGELRDVLDFLKSFATTGNFERFLADATLFMEAFSKIVVGWLWLDIGQVTLTLRQGGDSTYSPAFLDSKLRTLEFYFAYELPRVPGIFQTLRNDLGPTLREPLELFP